MIILMFPLNNMRFVLTFPSLDIQSKSTEAFKIKRIIHAIEISWNKFPKFVNLLVRLSNNNSSAFVLWLLWDFHSFIAFCREDSVFIVTNGLEVEFLIGWGVPFIDN